MSGRPKIFRALHRAVIFRADIGRAESFLGGHRAGNIFLMNFKISLVKFSRILQFGFVDSRIKYFSLIMGTTQFPNIRKVARFILAIPAAKASDDRNFYSSGQVLTPRRTTIEGETLCDFVFIHKSVSEPKLYLIFFSVC